MENKTETCQHAWRYNPDGYVEGCVPAICILCGKKGCGCDGEKSNVPHAIFFNKKGDAGLKT